MRAYTAYFGELAEYRCDAAGCDRRPASSCVGQISLQRICRHARAIELRELVPEFFEPWFNKFTIVRNLWRLIESNYHFFQADHEKLLRRQIGPGPRAHTCADYVKRIHPLAEKHLS